MEDLCRSDLSLVEPLCGLNIGYGGFDEADRQRLRWRVGSLSFHFCAPDHLPHSSSASRLSAGLPPTRFRARIPYIRDMLRV